MPQSRRTRTRSTDGFAARHFAGRQQRKLLQIRAQVALEAARIIATEGQTDFHAAKRKAAERIGVNERLALPSNLEVQDALLSYQSLYGGQQHADQLEKLRLAALNAMRMLGDYAPRLVGPVLDGSASEHSRVSLQVFCDAAETLVLDFLERGLPFRQEQRRLRGNDRNYLNVQVFVINVDGYNIELLLLPTLALRQSLPSPIDGKPQKRASLAELEQMLELSSSAA
ncbi:MAG TPA: hypothetical protein VFG52_03870 [Xanthomonadales bacterium]|nr:hypothetical protein [Xanthomonadales bacterium]